MVLHKCCEDEEGVQCCWVLLVVVFAAHGGEQWHGVHRPCCSPWLCRAAAGTAQHNTLGAEATWGQWPNVPWVSVLLFVSLPFRYVVSQCPSTYQVFEFCPNLSWSSHVWRPEKCKAERLSVFFPTFFRITWVVLAFSYCHHHSLYLPLFHLGAKSSRVLIRDLVGWYFPCAQEQLLFDLPRWALKHFAVCSLPFL